MKTLLAVSLLSLAVNAAAAQSNPCASKKAFSAEGREYDLCAGSDGYPIWVRIKAPETGGKWRHVTSNAIFYRGLDMRPGFMVRHEVPLGAPRSRGSDAMVTYQSENGVLALLDAYLAGQAVRGIEAGFPAGGCAEMIEHGDIHVCMGANGLAMGASFKAPEIKSALSLSGSDWFWISSAELWRFEKYALVEGGLVGADALESARQGTAPSRGYAALLANKNAKAMHTVLRSAVGKKLQAADWQRSALAAAGDAAASLVSP